MVGRDGMQMGNRNGRMVVGMLMVLTIEMSSQGLKRKGTRV